MENDKNIPWREISMILKGDADTRDEQILKEWLDLDSSNSAIFNEMVHLWEAIRQYDDYTPDVDEALAKIKTETIEKLRKDKLRHARRVALRFVATACFLVVAFCMYRLGGNIARIENESRLKIESFAQGNGSSKLLLSDGTEVNLRDKSRLSLSESGREVLLEGEAFFHVAKSSGNSFKVKTANCCVTVYGTKFNVRTDVQSKDVVVSLYEGSIALNSQSCTAQLHVGDIAKCSPSGVINIEEGDVLNENCWMNDMLQIRGATLGDVCKCLSRWYDVTVEVDQDIEGAYNYNFTLHGEPLDDVLTMMSLASPIMHKHRLDGSIQVVKSKETK